MFRCDFLLRFYCLYLPCFLYLVLWSPHNLRSRASSARATIATTTRWVGPVTCEALSLGKELELIPEQLEKIQALNREYYDEYRKVYSNVRKPGEPYDALAREEMAERQKALKEKLQEGLTKVLLPHQLERAKQVAFQMRTKNSAYIFSDQGIQKLLDISPEQAKQLQTKASELQKEVQQQYKAALEEARKKLLAELTPEQLAKLEKLKGEEYNPPPFDYRKYYEEQRKNKKAAEAKKGKGSAERGRIAGRQREVTASGWSCFWLSVSRSPTVLPFLFTSIQPGARALTLTRAHSC